MTHDTVIQATEAAADTIGRMTPADYGTTAHQNRTAQVRIASRGDRSPPCRNWYGDRLSRLRCGGDQPEGWKGIRRTGSVGAPTERYHPIEQVYHKLMNNAMGSRKQRLSIESGRRSLRRSPIPLPPKVGSALGGF